MPATLIEPFIIFPPPVSSVWMMRAGCDTGKKNLGENKQAGCLPEREFRSVE
jgi:hypothetical protein